MNRITVDRQLILTVSDQRDQVIWTSSGKPEVLIRSGDRAWVASLGQATEQELIAYSDSRRKGHRVRLRKFPESDVELELIYALGEDGELLAQVAHTGGKDSIGWIRQFYRFEKPVSSGGYMIIPHGAGYLLPADCPDALENVGVIGAKYTLPFFGMVKGRESLYALVENWWDTNVTLSHVPGDRSALDFEWLGSLGSLSYPRRLLLRFQQGMDYVGMAKAYRKYAKEQGLLRTLEEKSLDFPMLHRYLQGIEFRWTGWSPANQEAILDDIRKLEELGLKSNLFFPKWGSKGGTADPGLQNPPMDGGWQGWLRSDPVPNGWGPLAAFAGQVHGLGSTVKAMWVPYGHYPEAPDYDNSRWSRDSGGKARICSSCLGLYDAPARLRRGLEAAQGGGLKIDALYFDGLAAHALLPEDYSPEHPMTRRQNIEAQVACFQEAARRGVIPGGELPRFWAMADSAFFFFEGTWSSDRLTNVPTKGAKAPVGEPIPLFQLVFHDCYWRHFSGGGYAIYNPGYDWWPDRTPRLYELLFGCTPSWNWLPYGYVPIRWEMPEVQRSIEWLKRWSRYRDAIATSEMISHAFLSEDRKLQRLQFANGIVADFDMKGNRFKISGPGFSGQWEEPEALSSE